MIRVGITGQHGFIGKHLYNSISLHKDEFTIIEFERAYFNDIIALSEWIKKCDVIVHLAAMNRHNDQNVIHNNNVSLVDSLIEASDASKTHPYIIFASSTQEELDNLYSQSKKYGRNKLSEWAKTSGVPFCGLIIPNVFGPFGKPFYNSFVATFCFQLCNGFEPEIQKDALINFIYVNELTDFIIQCIKIRKNDDACFVNATHQGNVSTILTLLKKYKAEYLDNGIIPDLKSNFEIQLFNTFRSYINYSQFFPVKLKPNVDNRGVFTELLKVNIAGQVSYSTTHPGVVRGNHFHTRKIERFMVIKGKALIQLRKFNESEIINLELDGNIPSYVDMPVWYLHNIKNIGNDELYTVFWINEFFDPANPDTFFEIV